MPRISLYVDQDTLKDEYPKGFFDLFGSAKDDTMVRPPQIDSSADIKREDIFDTSICIY